MIYSSMVGTQEVSKAGRAIRLTVLKKRKTLLDCNKGNPGMPITDYKIKEGRGEREHTH